MSDGAATDARPGSATRNSAWRNSAWRNSAWMNVLVAAAVLVAVTVIACVMTRIDARGATWDEIYHMPVVEAIVGEGWSAENALDYRDTKGPVFFWVYAGIGEVIGADRLGMRLLTRLMFVLTAIPLGLIAARCGLTRGPTALVALLFALLPYNLVPAIIFMSEPSFMMGSMFLVLAFLWGFAAPSGDVRRVAGPIAFGLILALLLHHRPHVVACAGALVLVATGRDRAGSWPWWTACAAAAILRVPLYIRWGGMVPPYYGDLAGLGFRLDSLTYLAASLLPCTGVLLVAALATAETRGRALWTWLGIGAAAGLVLGLVARPDLSYDEVGQRWRYMGIVATVLRPLGAGALYAAAIAALSTLGGAALGATCSVACREPITTTRGAVQRAAALTIVLGWLLYAITRGDVFDRYQIAFLVLLPFLWQARVPRWLLVAQAVGLLVMVAKLARSHGML